MMDIFAKVKEGDRYYWSVGVKRYVKRSVPAEFYDSLSTVEFNGNTYSVPADYEGYLTVRYGDWRVQKKEWDYSTDDLLIEKQDEGQ